MSVDSSQLLYNQNAVSSDMMYDLKKSTGTSRRYRCNVPPNNFSSNIAASSNVIFSIPCGRKNTYLDHLNSFIRITVKNNDGTNAITLDNCGAALINMITTYHGGNLIDQTPSYNLLFNYLLDFNASLSQHVGGLSSTMGTSGSLSGSSDVVSAIAGSSFASAVAGTTVIGSITNEPFSGLRKGYTIPASGSTTVCLPLVTNLFLNSDKMIPLGKLKGDIELQILLESMTRSVISAGTTAWTISNMEMVLEIIELSDQSQSIVDEFTPPDRPIYIHSNSWRYLSTPLPNGTIGQFSSLISARYNSLKTIVCLPQLSTHTSSQNAWSLSSRVNPNIDYYSWRVGSSIVPAKPVYLNNPGSTASTTAGFSESYMELLKSLGGANNMYSNQIVGQTQYNVWDAANNAALGINQFSVAASSYNNGFAIAQELEVYSQRSDLMLQGVNTIGQNIFHDINISTAISSAYILNYFVNFDVLLIIENGVLRSTW